MEKGRRHKQGDRRGNETQCTAEEKADTPDQAGTNQTQIEDAQVQTLGLLMAMVAGFCEVAGGGGGRTDGSVNLVLVVGPEAPRSNNNNS